MPQYSHLRLQVLIADHLRIRERIAHGANPVSHCRRGNTAPTEYVVQFIEHTGRPQWPVGASLRQREQ